MQYLVVVYFFLFISDISDVLRKSPNKHELLEQLADIDDKWPQIGLALKVGDNVLRGLECSQNHNIVKLNDVLQSWITRKSSPVTWKNVITAIKGPIVNDILKAEEIRNYQSTCK